MKLKLYELTISKLNKMLKEKEISVLELTNSILERIRALEGKTGCYISVTEEEAIKRAIKLQEKFNNGMEISPLTGIPMGVKDNICTEGIGTTCGSKMLDNFIPPYNATVIKKLYDKGAILLGKLNMDEFAMGSTTETSYFKLTKNPWDLERVPGGSSGGSAVATMSGEAIYTLGTDTGGSIRQPASFCGVVGMKPTYGLVSRFGVIAYASSLDHVGPISKDVTDCALIMNAIVGKDPMDQTSSRINSIDYTESLINNIKNVKIGIPKEFINTYLDEDVRKNFLHSIKILEKLGAKCEEFSIPVIEYSIPVYRILSSAEASSNLGMYDGIRFGYRASGYSDLDDLYKKSRGEAFGLEVKKRVLMGTYVLSSERYDKYYRKALQVRRVLTDEFKKVFEKYDIVIGPTSPVTAFKFGEIKNYDRDRENNRYIFTAPANLAGLPAISIPSGLDRNGLPIGLQFIGRPFSEGILLKAAYTFEQNIGFQEKPAI